MVSMTFSIEPEVKREMEVFAWVNWSEVAREILLKRLKKEVALKRLSELMKNSEMTDKLSMELGKALKDRIYKRIKSSK